MKNNREISVLVLMSIYLILLGAINFYRDFPLYKLIGDCIAVGILIIFTFLTVVINKQKIRKRLLSSAIILFTFVCIPLCFFVIAEFEGHKLLMLIPPVLLVAANFKGNMKINLLCFTLIYYIILATASVSLPFFIEVEFIDPGFSVQLWTFALTFVLIAVLTIIYSSSRISYADPEKTLESFKELVTDSEDNISLDFVIENSAEIMEKYGHERYHEIYLLITKFMEKFSDETITVVPYCGNRFMFIFKNLSESFIKEFAESVASSVKEETDIDEEVIIGFNIHEKSDISQ
ncbi:MAG: hypothetical protein E7388_01665 [Ruminococcaceae bacterium]|nr:hypothetical protein [Oscillospiraceae bacterium]